MKVITLIASIAAVILALGTPVVVAAPIPEPLSSKEEMQEYALKTAQSRGVRPAVVFTVIDCETGNTWDPEIVGDHGHSVGLAQIYDKYNPDVDPELRKDARFSIRFLVTKLADGKGSAWTCYRKHYQ